MSLLDGADGRRFIVVTPEEIGWDKYTVVIADFAWWIQNEKGIYDWMEQHLPKGRMHHEGMVLSIPSGELVTQFLLQWG